MRRLRCPCGPARPVVSAQQTPPPPAHFFRLDFGIHQFRVHEEANQRCLRKGFVQDLKLFRGQRTNQESHAGDVAAGAVETGDKAQLDRITTNFEVPGFNGANQQYDNCR
jgi:hypothetical protein